MANIDAASVAAGFDEAILDAQRTFRCVMHALARPGTVVRLAGLPIPPAPLHATTAAICLSLADFETPVWLDVGGTDAAAVSHLRFHTGCPIVEQSTAACFVVVTNPKAMPPLSNMRLGTDERPDTSATLLLQVADLAEGTGWLLSGPGIANARRLAVTIPDFDLRRMLRENHALFPCGIDLFLCAPDRLAALPRTTRIEG